jgi:hypothetical protein
VRATLRGVRRTAAALTAALAALVVAGPASAADPGRWANTGVNRIPLTYYQGVTSDPSRNFYFDGVYTGLYRTDSQLRQTAASPEPGIIPPAVRATEQYNHIGDIGHGTEEGGRVLLPLECYYPGAPGGANTCQNGAIGVADPQTLAWRYYVKLDPAGIKKAMWVERSPDGTLLWSSDGDDLVAYKSSDVNPANAAPGTVISETKRLTGAVPPAGITGAAFYNGRLYTAGQDNGGLFQVWSTDLDSWDSATQSGDQRLEIELPAGTVGESEGLALNPTCGGVLHWIVTPFNTEGKPPTYGPTGNALLGFTPTGEQAPGSACRTSQPGSGGSPGAGSGSQIVGGSPPTPVTARATLRLGRTRGMRFAHRGRPFRLRARALGSGMTAVRLGLYSRSGKGLGHSRLFRMPRGRLLRPHIWVRHRLPRGRYTIVARAAATGGTRLRAARRGIVIRRR